MTKWSWFPCRHNHRLMRWQPHSSQASYRVFCGELHRSPLVLGSIFLFSLPSSQQCSIILPFPDVNIVPTTPSHHLERAAQTIHNTHNHKTFDNTNINFNISNTNFSWVISSLEVDMSCMKIFNWLNKQSIVHTYTGCVFFIHHQEWGCCELVFGLWSLPCDPKTRKKLLFGKKHSLMGFKIRQADCQQKGKVQDVLIWG